MAKRMNNLSGKEWLQYSFSIWRDIQKSSEERKLKHPAMFPIQLAEKLIKIYTLDDEEVVLDPFLGVGSTILAANNLSRKGIGIELNEDYAKIANERFKQSKLYPTTNSKTSEVIIGDSRLKLKELKDSSVDLCITSPPYWDILNQKRTADYKEIRKYSDSESDLGNISSYTDFFNELRIIFKEVYRVLKPNKRCCVVIMDIRKKDKFFPLHIDLTKIMEEVGFELEDIIIWDRQHEYNNMKTLGYPWVFRVNKVHEFICIYWKRK